MSTGRRLFLQKSAGAGILSLFIRGPLGRLTTHISSRMLNWGGLRFSTHAIRRTLPHPATRWSAEAITAATAVLLARKGVSALSRPASTAALLRISTAAVRAQMPHPRTTA
jgi:hypothetical protein